MHQLPILNIFLRSVISNKNIFSFVYIRHSGRILIITKQVVVLEYVWLCDLKCVAPGCGWLLPSMFFNA